MLKYIVSIVLLINSIWWVEAQKQTDAQKLISNFITSVKSQAIRTDFELKITEKKPVNSQQFSGSFLLKGNMFFLDMNEMQVWFNGKTQWAYLKQSNEVNITEPTVDELAETNPVAILSAFQAKSQIKAGVSKNQQNQMVELTPKNKQENFSKVEVQFAKSTGNLVSIVIRYKNGVVNQILLKNYRKNVAVPAGSFVFDKTKYKGLVMNDLR